MISKELAVFLMVCGLAWGLYFIRRGLRKRLEKMDEHIVNKEEIIIILVFNTAINESWILSLF